MRKWVREKLLQVDDWYPAERLEASKGRWRRLWNGEGQIDRNPFVYSPATFNYYDDLHTPEGCLRASLDEFIIRGRMNDDFIPSFFPGCRQSTIPEMFGAREMVEGRDCTVERLLRDIEEVDRLPPPTIGKGGVADSWLEMQRYLVEETEGRIPVHVTDMQGPADVCGQLLGYEAFFLSSYTHPELFHRLMGMATDAFIMFWRKQQELLGELFVGTHLFGWDWVPENSGASLSADSLVMISPDYYEEFYRPYLIRIGEAFGGLAVHSCSNFAGVMKSLCATPFLKAVNAGQMTVPEMLRAGISHDLVIIAHAAPVDIPELARLARENRLRLDLSVSLWPTKDLSTLGREDWDELEKIERGLLDALST